MAVTVTIDGIKRVYKAFEELAVEEYRELVAPQPAHNVPGVEEVGEDLPRLADGLVPGLVAQGVVDPLAVVQVHNEQGAGVLRPQGAQPVLHHQLQSLPVEKAREGVLGGPALQLFQLVFQPGPRGRPALFFHRGPLPFYIIHKFLHVLL